MVSVINSMGFMGMDTFLIKVEVDISKGMPSFDIVGLPDASVKESRNRVRASIKNCGFNFPLARITVNLSPADIKKVGSIYDLPIFIGILQASGQLNVNIDNAIFVGELSLNGELHSINGVLSMTMEAKKLKFQNIYVPHENGLEAGIVKGINIFAINHVNSLVKHLENTKTLTPQPVTTINVNVHKEIIDFSQVKGQFDAKRALEIAAAGGHNILLIGPPGSGKSMLAKRLNTILPDMTFEEMLQTTKIHSIAGILDKKSPLVLERPFRAPHHTISPAGLSGGGSTPNPGELSLAHNGVLFLDELPEFTRNTMETLRQPIEDGIVTISRVKGTASYPCSVILIVAMNPCPCGYYSHPTRKCICSERAILKYLNKVSGPLLDRIDLHIEVPPVDFENIYSDKVLETSNSIRKRVNFARKLQNLRYKDTKIFCNAKVPTDILRQVCKLTDKAKNILKFAFEKLGLSARAYDKILKVSRTIADLDNSELILDTHISEAIQYRSLDRKYWFKES